jgi:hypothetical protein
MVTPKKATISRAHSLTLPPWKNLMLQERIRKVVLYADQQKGHAVTLNFSDQFAEYIRAHAEPMRQIQKRMNQEFLKLNLQSLPLLLILEVTDESARPHLHGVFIPGGTDVKRIQQAMRRSVGYVLHHRGSRQFKSEIIYDAPIWSKYITKQLRRTKRVLSVNCEKELIWISHAITSATRDHYESIRLGRVKSANLTSRPTSTAV